MRPLLLLLVLLAGCAPGQFLLINADHGSCVQIYTSGNPTGGTATLTATIPVSAVPALGVRSLDATEGAAPEGPQQTCRTGIAD